MSDAIILSLISTAGAIITPILLLYVKSVLSKVDKHLADVHKQIDGRMGENIEMTRTIATALGKEEGIAQQKEEAKQTQADIAQTKEESRLQGKEEGKSEQIKLHKKK